MKISLNPQKILFLTAGLLILSAIAFVALRSGPLAPVMVTVEKVKEGNFHAELFGIGTVEARRSWMIGPTAAGRVLSVKVDVGERVTKGQLLAEMDPVDLDQRMASLDASLDKAASAQTAASAQQKDAMARLDLATSNMQRNQDLADKNFISPGALEARAQEKISALAMIQVAAANTKSAGQELTRLKAERAALQQQRVNVRLLSPVDGVVTTRDAEAGSTVVAGQPVLRLIDPASLWIKLRIDQGRSAGLVPHLKAQISLRSQAQDRFEGQVERIEILSDSITEERIAMVSFTRSPMGISVGEMAEVALQLPVSAKAISVPNASLHQQGLTTGVWRMVAGKPVFAAIRTGASSLDGQVQILEGLQADQEIVVYSQKTLNADSHVQVTPSLVKPQTRQSAAP